MGNPSNTRSSNYNGTDKSNITDKGKELHRKLHDYIQKRLEEADPSLEPDEREVKEFIDELEERFKLRIIASELEIIRYARHQKSDEIHRWHGKIDAIGVTKDCTVVVIDWKLCMNDLRRFWKLTREFSPKLHQTMIYQEKLAAHLKHFFEEKKFPKVPKVGIMIVPISSKSIKDSDPRLCTNFENLREAGFFEKIGHYNWTTQNPSKEDNSRRCEQKTDKVRLKAFWIVKPHTSERTVVAICFWVAKFINTSFSSCG